MQGERERETSANQVVELSWEKKNRYQEINGTSLVFIDIYVGNNLIKVCHRLLSIVQPRRQIRDLDVIAVLYDFFLLCNGRLNEEDLRRITEIKIGEEKICVYSNPIK